MKLKFITGLLHAAGIRVMTVGIVNGNKFNQIELEGIASDPDSRNLFTIKDYSELTTTLADNLIQRLIDGMFILRKKNGLFCLLILNLNITREYRMHRKSLSEW